MASPPLDNNTYSVVSYLSFDSAMHGRTIMDSAAFLIDPNTDYGANRLVAQINDTRGNIDTRKLPNNYALVGPSTAALTRPNKNLPVKSTFAIGGAASGDDGGGGGGGDAGPVIGWEG